MVLFVKLFAIMGLTWFTECVHVVLHDHDHSYSDYCNFYVEASHSLHFVYIVHLWKGFIHK